MASPSTTTNPTSTAVSSPAAPPHSYAASNAATTQSALTTQPNTTVPNAIATASALPVATCNNATTTGQNQTGQHPGSAPNAHFWHSPTLENILGTIVLVFTVIGLGWGFGIGAVGLDLQKWTARNDALQSCLSWQSTGHSSRYCNETIEAGVTRPPLLKRAQVIVYTSNLIYGSPYSAYQLALVTTTTLCIGVCTLIYFRPRTELFRPVVSNVRTYVSLYTPVWISITRHTPHLIRRSILVTQQGTSQSHSPGWQVCDDAFPTVDDSFQVGERIGLFYVSDSESDYDEDDTQAGKGPAAANPTSPELDPIQALQEQHVSLMDWLWKQDVDDENLHLESADHLLKLLELPLDQFLAITTAVCSAVHGSLADSNGDGEADSRGPHEIPAEGGVATSSSMNHAYVWAVIRAISERNKRPHISKSFLSALDEPDDNASWAQLVSRWYKLTADLKHLRQEILEADLQSLPDSAHTHSSVRVLHDIETVFSFAEAVETDESLCGHHDGYPSLSAVCNCMLGQPATILSDDFHGIRLGPDDLHHVLRCARCLLQRGEDALAAMENVHSRQGELGLLDVDSKNASNDLLPESSSQSAVSWNEDLPARLSSPLVELEANESACRKLEASEIETIDELWRSSHNCIARIKSLDTGVTLCNGSHTQDVWHAASQVAAISAQVAQRRDIRILRLFVKRVNVPGIGAPDLGDGLRDAEILARVVPWLHVLEQRAHSDYVEQRARFDATGERSRFSFTEDIARLKYVEQRAKFDYTEQRAEPDSTQSRRQESALQQQHAAPSARRPWLSGIRWLFKKFERESVYPEVAWLYDPDDSGGEYHGRNAGAPVAPMQNGPG